MGGLFWSVGGDQPKQKEDNSMMKRCTIPETNIAPENGWLEDEFPFGTAYFQGQR